MGGVWFVQVIRYPEDPQFARGGFGARLRLWFYYPGDLTELVTVNAAPEDVFVPLPEHHKIIEARVYKCDAFDALKA